MPYGSLVGSEYGRSNGAYTLIHERNVLQKFDMSNRSKSFSVCIMGKTKEHTSTKLIGVLH